MDEREYLRAEKEKNRILEMHERINDRVKPTTPECLFQLARDYLDLVSIFAECSYFVKEDFGFLMKLSSKSRNNKRNARVNGVFIRKRLRRHARKMIKKLEKLLKNI